MNLIQLGVSGIIIVSYLVQVCISDNKLYQMFNITSMTNIFIMVFSICSWSFAIKNSELTWKGLSDAQQESGLTESLLNFPTFIDFSEAQGFYESAINYAAVTLAFTTFRILLFFQLNKQFRIMVQASEMSCYQFLKISIYLIPVYVSTGLLAQTIWGYLNEDFSSFKVLLLSQLKMTLTKLDVDYLTNNSASLQYAPMSYIFFYFFIFMAFNINMVQAQQVDFYRIKSLNNSDLKFHDDHWHLKSTPLFSSYHSLPEVRAVLPAGLPPEIARLTIVYVFIN